jgi:type VI secretion system FHA domain protein
VILILEVTSSQATKLAVSRQTFSREGGSIGRNATNTWVLPHAKVSGRHALISYQDGTFYIEDKSTNGVFLNSSRNRLERDRPYPLTSGDRILIDAYEILVSVVSDQRDRSVASPHRSEESRGMSVPPAGYNASNPFDTDDPFAPRPDSMSPLDAPEELRAPDELDPLALLNLGRAEQAPPAKAPSAKDLDRGLALDAHFKPPAVLAPPPPPPPTPPPISGASNTSLIPDDYDPLAPDEPSSIMPRPAPLPAAPRPVAAAPPPPPPPPAPAPPPPIVQSPPRVDHPPPARPSALAVAQSADSTPSIDLSRVLEGAGLDPAGVTPELAETFGRILRVVVTGVMDVMRSRQQIKDEFRMQMTRFRVAENNPLKFSANVDDALHNLLVKRNPAYLGAVAAFEDAFDDLRNHQIAMLAGMRMAFESMLAEFDPDRLQQEFDKQKGLVPAKLRYWDLYRERLENLIKDREAAFRQLFGEEFAQAYEEQLRQLKARARGAGSPPSPRPPEE